ncbi:unnamed protein product, partial [Closterium sp. NIES-53]
GVDCFQTFSPTPKMTTLRVLLHVAAQRDYELHSLDFSTAFLQGSLHEEIWLRRPPGFTGTTLAALGFAPSTADPSLFLRTDTSLPPFYILMYVDDLVFATADTAGLTHVKSELQKRHTCTDLGELRCYLGLHITRDRAQRTITLTQSHMVRQVLQHFDFTYSSPQATPLSTRHSLSALPSDESVEPSGPYPELVGCLMYLMTCTRPDLAYPLSILARYVAHGRHQPKHMAAAKRLLRYLCSTSGLGLVLGGRRPVVLTGHADASWADVQATQRSSQGYTFSLGSGSVSWRSTCSSSVLGSSCEAEIYAGAMAAQELRWLTYLLTDLGEPPRSPPVLYVDNKAMLALCREHRLEHRTKHIALRYFLARELQQRGQLRLAYVASEANTADIFTKALPPGDHQRFCTMLACFALLDWSCDLLFSPTLPMGSEGLGFESQCVHFGHPSAGGCQMSTERRSRVRIPVCALRASQCGRVSDVHCQQLTVSRDVKFLESLYYKEWKQQQQKLPTTPLIIEADEVQRPSRQVQVTVLDEEISGVTEDGGEPEVEEQQLQQQDAPPRAQRPLDQPRRDVRPPNMLTYPTVPKPKTLAEALSGPDAEKWKQSVKEEYDSLLENETWELCELPPGKKVISSKLIFRHKYGPDGELTRYKSRLVAKGFQQTKGKDFDEIFAPVGKGTTLRVMLGMAANRGWRIKQMDITTDFLNGIILEELYMQQPEGLDDGSGRVCRLKKAIYGLKQAPRAWYHKLEETLLAGGFKKSECDHSLFLLQEKEQFLMLLVYVDDILLFSESAAMIERVEEMLEMQFKCSKMGDVKYYLGMHVERDLDKGVLRLHQRKHCEGLAEKYGLQDGGKPATPLPSGVTVEPCADEELHPGLPL